MSIRQGNNIIAGTQDLSTYAKTADVNTALALKANQSTTYTKVDVDNKFTALNRVGFAAYNSQTSIPAATWTKAVFASKNEDTNNAWDGSNFTIPKSGMYLFTCGYVFTTGTDGGLVAGRLVINDNLSTGASGPIMGRNVQGSTTACGFSGAVRMGFNAGDKVSLYVYNAAACTGNTIEPWYTHFSAYAI